MVDVVIIGGGPAGLSAAIRAKEKGAEPLILERGDRLGGILNQCIHHGFGLHVFKEELTGPEYARRLIDRASELGVRYELNAMTTDASPSKEITYVSKNGTEKIKPKAVILAMGCRERTRGALGIPGDRGAGIFTAGTAQTFVNLKGLMPGKRTVILGSGDIGLIMARRLALEGAEVAGVYELMPYSAGLKRNIAQCLHDYGIPLHLSHTVTRIVGRKRVEGVYVANVDGNLRPVCETERFVECDSLLLSVGLIPENELAKKMGIKLSQVTGGAEVNDRLETSVPGVFACGNSLHVHDLADNVTLEAYRAAESAADYIANGEIECERIPVEAGSGVRYVVPFEISYSGGGREYEIFFRSDAVYRRAEVSVCADEREIHFKKKRIVTPGEMETAKIKIDGPAKKITVKVGGER